MWDSMADISFKRILWRETIAGVLLLAAGLVCAGFVAANLANDLSVWVLGRSATGHVTEQWVERVGDQTEGELAFRYYMRYDYTTQSGKVFTQTTTMSVTEWSNFDVGSPVEVIYFSLAPSRARLADQRFISIYVCAYLPFAIVAWAGLKAGSYLLRLGIGRPPE
jgi:hypothetical protein